MGTAKLSKPLYIPVEKLQVLPNIPAGMNPLVVMSLMYMYRSSGQDAPPILIQKESKNVYRVIDGRHRFLASVMAGRSTVLAIKLEKDQSSDGLD